MPASPLRNGQIIQGKVMKLFPNQRAEIQIGGQKVIAKLDASLTLHRSYHFQVQIKGGIIYLHVLAEQQKKTNESSSSSSFLAAKIYEDKCRFYETITRTSNSV